MTVQHKGLARTTKQNLRDEGQGLYFSCSTQLS